MEKKTIETLQPHMDQYGFEWLSPHSQFRKITDYGFQSLVLSFSHYSGFSIVEAHYGIRYNEVENLIYGYANVTPHFRYDSFSLIISSAQLTAQRFDRIELRDKADAVIAGQQILTIFKEQGLLFFSQYSNLEEMERLFNQNAPEFHSFFTHLANRAMRGLALAYLCKKANIEELYEAYLTKLKERYTPQPTIDYFRQFKAALVTLRDDLH